jgi:quercetin dioxygenase-like cupin family protein
MMGCALVPGEAGWQAGRGQPLLVLDGAATDGRLSLVLQELAQGDEFPKHRHHWEDEAIYVLDGEIAAYIGDRWRQVAAGAAAIVPRGTDHAIVARTARARLLTVYTPAGFEGYYRDLGETTGALELVVTTAARYGCEVTGAIPDSPSAPHRTA